MISTYANTHTNTRILPLSFYFNNFVYILHIIQERRHCHEPSRDDSLQRPPNVSDHGILGHHSAMHGLQLFSAVARRGPFSVVPALGIEQATTKKGPLRAHFPDFLVGPPKAGTANNNGKD